MAADLFEPLVMGDLMLANRMVLASMTRNRADRDGVAAKLACSAMWLTQLCSTAEVRQAIPIGRQLRSQMHEALKTQPTITQWMCQ